MNQRSYVLYIYLLSICAFMILLAIDDGSESQTDEITFEDSAVDDIQFKNASGLLINKRTALLEINEFTRTISISDLDFVHDPDADALTVEKTEKPVILFLKNGPQTTNYAVTIPTHELAEISREYAAEFGKDLPLTQPNN